MIAPRPTFVERRLRSDLGFVLSCSFVSPAATFIARFAFFAPGTRGLASGRLRVGFLSIAAVAMASRWAGARVGSERMTQAPAFLAELRRDDGIVALDGMALGPETDRR